MADFEVDLFVVGAGSGGVRAARIAAGYGAKVMIAEEHRVGGTCVIRGCVPKKLYVQASRLADDFADAHGLGWRLPETPIFDWPSLVAAKEREIERLSGLYVSNMEKAGVSLVRERAVLTGPHEVRLTGSGRTITARHILVATGGTPQRGPLFRGLDLAVTSDAVFDLPALPTAMLIVGSGYIAVEFACLFARFGVEVTLAFRGEKPLRGFDEDVRDALAAAMIRAGVKLKPGCMPARLEKAGARYRAELSDGSILDVDATLLATGRIPHTSGLGLEAAGVETDRHGAIVVRGLSQTSIPSIHAVGDVTNRVNLTPVAIREGHAFADIMFGGRAVEVRHDLVPTAVFTTPEIGVVGLTEDAAVASHGDVDIYQTSFRPIRATLSGREDRTMMKIVVDAASDLVLGVHIFGDAASEMIQLVGVAMRMGAKKSDFDATMAVHPTAAEELVTMRAPARRHRRAASAS
jgi:glutathione reductase (NADPH)